MCFEWGELLTGVSNFLPDVLLSGILYGYHYTVSQKNVSLFSTITPVFLERLLRFL